MLEEINSDISNNRLYMSGRLNATGQADYPDLLKEAATLHNDTWLASQLRNGNRMNAQESRKKPSGGTTIANVPVTAPDTLAEGEFNRFYIRGLCLYAAREKIDSLVVYRAKQVENARSESQRKIGTTVSASNLLNDLRNSPGVDTALGLPAGPNSGLSVKRP